jgi:hypothetical protein
MFAIIIIKSSITVILFRAYTDYIQSPLAQAQKEKAITCRNFPNRPTEMSLVAKLLLALALTPSVILALTSPSSSLIQVWIFAFKAGELNTILRTPCPHPNPVYPPYLYKTLAIRMGIMIEENQLALNVYQSRMSRSS